MVRDLIRIGVRRVARRVIRPGLRYAYQRRVSEP